MNETKWMPGIMTEVLKSPILQHYNKKHILGHSFSGTLLISLYFKAPY